MMNDMEAAEVYLQLGPNPPFTLIRLPLRWEGDVQQFGVRHPLSREMEWYDLAGDFNTNPPVKSFGGRPVVGITTNWRRR